ncbi:hypothetical protein [Bacillus cereus]|uniref:Uncharacterized protein n=1 Tax=Bacillus cereus MC67 TaxID=1053219 RepID=J8ETC6_BACCE|nr:hypothetical protein [Bacillus cereus]EJQ91775.1 hypothetical protein II3_05515 [Bacillus cereus MC67]EOO99855.1 hypothetical protein II1_05255 [Bacillus cereus MC118]
MANVVLIIRNSDLLRSMDEILTNSKSVKKVHELMNKAKTKNIQPHGLLWNWTEFKWDMPEELGENINDTKNSEPILLLFYWLNCIGNENYYLARIEERYVIDGHDPLDTWGNLRVSSLDLSLNVSISFGFEKEAII